MLGLSRLYQSSEHFKFRSSLFQIYGVAVFTILPKSAMLISFPLQEQSLFLCLFDP